MICGGVTVSAEVYIRFADGTDPVDWMDGVVAAWMDAEGITYGKMGTESTYVALYEVYPQDVYPQDVLGHDVKACIEVSTELTADSPGEYEADVYTEGDYWSRSFRRMIGSDHILAISTAAWPTTEEA